LQDLAFVGAEDDQPEFHVDVYAPVALADEAFGGAQDVPQAEAEADMGEDLFWGGWLDSYYEVGWVDRTRFAYFLLMLSSRASAFGFRSSAGWI
jgi:hypothetical protein